MTKQLICVSLILLPLLAVVAEGSLLGGWKQIKDLSDPTVVEIAKFAISKHREESKADLVFEKVVGGKTQVVSGTKYDLIIAAKNGAGGATKNYQAIVWDQPWKKSKVLESFKAV